MGASLSLGLILVLGSHYGKERAHRDLASAQAELTALQSQQREKQADLIYIQRHIGPFNRLAQIGLVGTPEREAWVEQLLLSAKRAGLSPSLRYTLLAPRPVSPQLMADGTASDRSAPQSHDLEFSLSGLHEEEFLALLQDYSSHTWGRFRVNACQLSEPTRLGLKLQCVLRFFTLAQTVPQVASASAPAASSSVPAPPLMLISPRLGTLFYEPAERSAMVFARSGDAAGEFSQQARVAGIVQRERGNSTAWINSQAVADGQSLPPSTRTGISASAVTLNGQRLRVGETLDFATGGTTDILPAGALTTKALK